MPHIRAKRLPESKPRTRPLRLSDWPSVPPSLRIASAFRRHLQCSRAARLSYSLASPRRLLDAPSLAIAVRDRRKRGP
eukprot:5321848-Pleurochrysis_carterae.AAC.1